MKGLTDIHNHIIFKVDDGAVSIENSMEILNKEYAQGVRNVICTPHFHMGECMPDLQVVKNNFEALKKRTAKELSDMNLYLGNEIMACNDMVDMLDDGRLLTLAGSQYVLVEFYPTVGYSVMEKTLSRMLNGGYTPIVAHCERYRCLRSSFKVINYNNINHLTEMGSYMQVNATSVFGKDKKFVTKLIQNDFLHFIATDAHSIRTRGVYWDQCIQHLERHYNQEYIKWLLIENPKKVLEGKSI